MRRRRRWVSRSRRFLAAHQQVRVRFQEVDSLHIVWHGHYLTYFEEGRNAFGRKFAFGYQDILAAGYIAPIVHIELDFFRPAKFDQLLGIETRMHLDPAARIQFSYIIRADADGEKLAAGSSVQAFTDESGALVLTQPAFYTEFLARWADDVQEE